MNSSLEYLKRLPQALAYRGDSRAGEIEVIPADSKPGDHGAQATGVLFEDKYLLVVRDPVRFPSGRQGTYIRIVEKPALHGPAGVVALCQRDGQLYFLRNFRHATRTWEVECVRGFCEPGVAPEEMVRREIHEELGAQTQAVVWLGDTHSNSGLLAGTAKLYLATLAAPPATRSAEDAEAIAATLAVPVAEVDRFLIETPVRDGFSLSAIALARARGLLPAANLRSVLESKVLTTG